MNQERPGVAKAKRLSSVLDEALGKSSRPELVRGILGDLQVLLDGGPDLHARLRGDSETGEAFLVRLLGPHDANILWLAWNQHQIRHIQLKSRQSLKEIEALPPAEPASVVERLVPMLWAHVRAGGTLPRGVHRFASFFSLR